MCFLPKAGHYRNKCTPSVASTSEPLITRYRALPAPQSTAFYQLCRSAFLHEHAVLLLTDFRALSNFENNTHFYNLLLFQDARYNVLKIIVRIYV